MKNAQNSTNFLVMIAVIIDSYPVFLNGLTQLLLGVYPGVKIVKSLNIESFDESRGDIRPDFIILGVNNIFKSRDLKIFEVVRRSLPETATVLFYDELNMVLPLLKCGAQGFLAKKSTPEELIECLHIVTTGRRYLSDEIFDWIVNPS